MEKCEGGKKWEVQSRVRGTLGRKLFGGGAATPLGDIVALKWKASNQMHLGNGINA